MSASAHEAGRRGSDGPAFSIGQVAARTGVATSALRFYESEGLIHSKRNSGNQRRYHPEVIRRVSFIRVAQQVGLTLDEIREVMSSLPDGRTPTRDDWERVASSWAPRLDEQIALIERVKERLTGCIGCGCLTMTVCPMFNPNDELADEGPGPRILLHD